MFTTVTSMNNPTMSSFPSPSMSATSIPIAFGDTVIGLDAVQPPAQSP